MIIFPIARKIFSIHTFRFYDVVIPMLVREIHIVHTFENLELFRYTHLELFRYQNLK